LASIDLHLELTRENGRKRGPIISHMIQSGIMTFASEALESFARTLATNILATDVMRLQSVVYAGRRLLGKNVQKVGESDGSGDGRTHSSIRY
jgi:hypothetical protein